MIEAIVFCAVVIGFILAHGRKGGEKERVLNEILEKRASGDQAGAESTFLVNSLILVAFAVIMVVIGVGLIVDINDNDPELNNVRPVTNVSGNPALPTPILIIPFPGQRK